MSNACWQQLGISPTTDPDVIRSAFLAQIEAQKSRGQHDIRDLRHAYDEALRQARRLHSEGEELAESSSRELHEEVEDLQEQREHGAKAQTVNTEDEAQLAHKPFRLFDPAGRTSLVTPTEAPVAEAPALDVQTEETADKPVFQLFTGNDADSDPVNNASVDSAAEEESDAFDRTDVGDGCDEYEVDESSHYAGDLKRAVTSSYAYVPIQQMARDLNRYRTDLMSDPSSAIVYLIYLASCYKSKKPVTDLSITEDQYEQVQQLMGECFLQLKSTDEAASLADLTFADLYCSQYARLLLEKCPDPRISLLFLRVFKDRLFVRKEHYSMGELQLMEEVTNDATMPVGLRAYFAAHLYLLQERLLKEQWTQQERNSISKAIGRYPEDPRINKITQAVYDDIRACANSRKSGGQLIGPFFLALLALPVFAVISTVLIPAFLFYLIGCVLIYVLSRERIRDSVLNSGWNPLVASMTAICPLLMVPLMMIPADVLPNAYGPSRRYSTVDFYNLRALLKDWSASG
ncbi:hypothetical protein ACKC9G_17330 [Pokkaliibacter sp. CJK22405]|uniref:hypothetical protein n=1 Tax=Pokkaliibacter sp. CJK22405 TaxID=3384615 RepID=UPI00398524D3